MRVLSAWIVAGTVFTLGLASAQTPLIGQSDTALPGGVYAALNVGSAGACAQQCADDRICMAWTYRAAQNGACELKAVVPHPVEETGAISGTSSRAPAFARDLAGVATPSAAAPGEQTKVALNTTPTQGGAASADPSSQLLGGPSPGPDLGLRPQLPDEGKAN